MKSSPDDRHDVPTALDCASDLLPEPVVLILASVETAQAQDDHDERGS